MRLHTLSLSTIAAAMLAACGGGSGGGPSTYGGGVRPTPRDVPFHSPVRIDAVEPIVNSTNYTYDSSALISQDLSGNGDQSLILAGRMNPNNQTHHEYAMQVWDWDNGSLVNKTSQWFSGTDNQITGTEPSVEFGDFDNDGRIDMYVAPNTDSNVYGTGIVFFNEGTRFTRQNLNLENTHGHGSALYDLNNDGYLDIVTTGLRFTFGGPNRSFTTYWGRGDYPGGGGDVAAADFMGNGTSSIILTDVGSNQSSNNRLYTWTQQADGVYLSQASVLPTPRFLLPKWTGYGFSGSHDVRVLALDFDNSGLTDAVIFSRPWLTNGQWPAYSEIQFNKNNGGGVFQDVTDSVLVGYDNTSPVSYQPSLMDVNNDGLVDIVLTSTSWVDNTGAQVLIHTQEHKYVASYATVLQAFVDQSHSLEQELNRSAAFGGNVVFVRGPDSKMYLATAVSYQENNVQKKAIYLSQLGDNAVSATATASVIKQSWPWMSSGEVNQSLASSSVQYLNGIPVVDFSTAMQPIGDLGISITGRTGNKQSISGHISIPNLDSNILSRVTAVDGLSRNFDVDLSVMQYQSKPMDVQTTQVSSATESWSAKFVGNQHLQHTNWHLASNGANYSTGLSIPLDQNRSWTMGVSMSKISGSPWLSFSGVFGSVNQSNIIERSVTKMWSNGTWAQLGSMQTTTDFSPGLVTNVSDIWSVHAVGGWKDNNWSVYGGIQPTVVKGSVDIKLPSSVDNNGQMNYQSHRVQVRTDPVSFAGVDYTVNKFTMGVVANSLGQYNAKIKFTVDF